MPRVSVIITTHSRPELLPRAVASAAASGTDVEVIVVDDASTDSTANVCKGISGIKYIRLDDNHQTAGARNVGIEASLGEYISFHDDDDRKMPGSVDDLTTLLDREPNAGLAYGQAWAGNDELEPAGEPFPSEIVQGDVFWQLIESNFIPTITAVFRKSCLSEVGMVDEGLKGVDDYDLWIRIAEHYQVLGIAKPLGVWRAAQAGSGQGSSDRADRVLEAIRTNQVSNRALDSLARAANDNLTAEKTRAAVKLRTSEFLFWNAAENYRSGNISDMRTSLFAGLRYDTKRIVRPSVLKMAVRSVLPA
jgi:glycosyltransferase involved in cell wall biosynthesis